MYNINYYDNMLRNYSATAEFISRIRWDFVSCLRPKLVLDYGSGIGWFRAFAPKDVTCDTFDIMPVFQTGILHDIYDMVTFWDSLEHIQHEKYETLFNRANSIAVTIPIKPNGKPLKEWKHWKPKEHIFLPDEKELTSLFDAYGFELIKKGTPECPPRVDVHSFLFARPLYAKKAHLD